jgi:hypothetical protein
VHTSDSTEENRPGGVPRRRFLQGAGVVAAGSLLPGAANLLRIGSGSAAAAAEPVEVVVDAGARGPVIPSDFTGLSFERGALNSGNADVPGYFFSPTNRELVTLFRNAAIKNLRVGAGTVDQQIPVGTGSDGYKAVDELFRFAAAAGVSVNYNVRLFNPSSAPIPDLVADDADAANYIWRRYRGLVSSFSIGNEPDWHSFHVGDPAIFETTPNEPGTAYPSYLDTWREFAGAMHAAAPGAKFSGPDTGNYGTRGGVPYVTFTPDMATGISWTEQFTKDERGSGLLKDAYQHYYVGGSPLTTTAAQAIDNMLSAEWVEQAEIGTQPTGADSSTTAYVPYPWLYTRIVAPTVAAGLPVRLTESNDYLTGIPGASDAFASALWALDYMHWWAAHGANGVNFHNKQWIYTDTITPALGSYTPIPGSCSAPGCGNYRVAPKGYAIKAFDLGAHGEVKPLSLAKPSDVNLTAYAVGGQRDLYITVINKTHGAGSTDAQVTIEPQHFSWSDATSITLDAGEPGDPSSASATLGGATIGNDVPWQGKWSRIGPSAGGRVVVTVRAATATVVRLHG